MGEQVMLEAVELSAGYGSGEVIRDVSLSLREGKIVSILGPNGAGKTTLLRALNRSIPATSGEIRLDGMPIETYSRPEIAKRITVVAQENETSFPVTVREFVLSGRFAHGGVFGWESERDQAAAAFALELCELEGLSDQLMNRLSGGERQRVLLARALATEARVLLLDEPTANLDLPHQAMLFRLVRERCSECGAAAVVITHDLNLASEFADEILLLRDGSVIASGTPAEVLTKGSIKQGFDVEVLLDQNPSTGNVRVTTLY